MAFAQLFLQRIQLSEAVCIAPERITENVTGLVEDGNFVAFVQFASLVSSDQGLIDKGSVARQVLEHCNGITTLLLGEQQAVPIRDGR